jgi:hypothetical protein
MGAPAPRMHGATHAPGGPDPIPGLGTAASGVNLIQYEFPNDGAWLQVKTRDGGATGLHGDVRGMALIDLSSDGLEISSSPPIERGRAGSEPGFPGGIFLRTTEGAEIFMPDLATADPGREGALWNDGGTVVLSGSTAGGGVTPGDLDLKVDRDAVEAASNRLLQVKLAAADTQPAFRIEGDGRHEWGPGGATAADTTLYRTGPGKLKTDDQFYTGSYIAAFQGTANETTFGPAQVILGGDTILYRALAGFLKTDTAMSVAGDFYVERDVGTATHSAMSVTFSGIGSRIVQVGPPDSGGAGYRALRIAN